MFLLLVRFPFFYSSITSNDTEYLDTLFINPAYCKNTTRGALSLQLSIDDNDCVRCTFSTPSFSTLFKISSFVVYFSSLATYFAFSKYTSAGATSTVHLIVNEHVQSPESGNKNESNGSLAFGVSYVNTTSETLLQTSCFVPV